jgi:hypothetical protein
MAVKDKKAVFIEVIDQKGDVVNVAREEDDDFKIDPAIASLFGLKPGEKFDSSAFMRNYFAKGQEKVEKSFDVKEA